MANSIQQSQPNLASLLELLKGNIMMQLNCHQVGEIVSFDSSTQTAEVQIKMLKMINGKLEEYSILIDCPCVVLSGGKGRLTFPIEQGDSCIVLFNDRDIDNWYAGGQKMLPRTNRMHSYTDAIALVGIRNKQNQIEDYLQHGVELKYGKSTIKLENNKVTITNHKDTIVMDNRTTTITSPTIDINGNVNIVQNTVDKNSLTAYVIDTYHSGTDWYRVWSDGWCEQGGSATVASAGSTPVTLHKTFKDLNYSLLTTSNSAFYGVGEGNNTALKTSTSQITITNGSHITSDFTWEAKGYIS